MNSILSNPVPESYFPPFLTEVSSSNHPSNSLRLLVSISRKILTGKYEMIIININQLPVTLTSPLVLMIWYHE